MGEELSYREPYAFWWGGPHADLGHILIQHVTWGSLHVLPSSHQRVNYVCIYHDRARSP
jgi:hypothetical protein